MAVGKNKIVYSSVNDYIRVLKDNKINVWRVYLYGSYANGTPHKDSDIDLAIFLAQDELDGFKEDVTLMKLRRQVDTRIEPHSFARSDFDKTDPYISEILRNGKRII